MTSTTKWENKQEKKLYKITPDFAEAILVHCITVKEKDENGKLIMNYKALPIGWLIEWIPIILTKQSNELVSKIKKKIYAYDEAEDSGYVEWKDIKALVEEKV